MDQIRQIAIACVGRAVFFGAIAIGCVMIAFAFNPVSSFRSGAVLTLMMAGVLIFKALAAASQNPKHTEVWLYLDETTRPREAHAAVIFATIMREVYARFAQIALMVACGFFAASVVLTMLGFEPMTMPDN